jgi:hypothetical protein
MPKPLTLFKNGALVTFETAFPSGMHTVLLRNPQGEVHDKVRCDDYKEALAYFNAFKATAKNLWKAPAS